VFPEEIKPSTGQKDMVTVLYRVENREETVVDGG
jgi:hypothetical protein